MWFISCAFIVLIINFTNCYDIVRFDNDEAQFKNNVTHLKKKPKSVDNRTVYLEDVLFAIKHQNWSEEEQPCLNESLRMIHSLRNFTLWAVWDWDSISSEPLGLLYGNKYQLGNFDECLKSPWSNTHPELKTQYCLADITLESDNVVKKKDTQEFDPYQSAVGFIQHRVQYGRSLNEITWGICVPAACRARSVERLLSTAIARSHLGTAGLRARIDVNPNCQTTEFSREFDWQFYTFSVVMVLLGVIAINCTYLYAKIDKTDEISTKHEILKAFSLRENTQDLMKVNQQGAEVFYGIKFLTISLIVADHQVGVFNSAAVINGLETDKISLTPIASLILHDDLFVDTFFLLSGFLTASALTSFKQLPNPLILIVKRYVSFPDNVPVSYLRNYEKEKGYFRMSFKTFGKLLSILRLAVTLRLVIAFAIVIFYISSIYPHTGSGPLWPRAVAADTDQCRQNWWINLLMINNYVDSENICMVISWYVACDFHFFVVTVLLYWVYKRYPRAAWGCAGVLAVAALVVPGAIVYTSDLPAVQIFNYDFTKNPRLNLQFHTTYIKSHTRFASYIVGVLSGCLFVYVKSTGNIKRLSTKWSLVGALSGLIVMAVSMLTGCLFVSRDYTPLEGAIYAALNRPVWAFGVAMLVLSCVFGDVPLIKSFLNWYPWAPLSRLTYGIYLIHATYITRNVMSTRSSHYNDLVQLLTSATGVLVWSAVSAYVIWLLTEAPVNKLLALYLRKSFTRISKPEENNENVNNNDENIISATYKNDCFIQENLPPVITVSSKV